MALILIDECKIKDPDLIIAALLHDSIEDSAIFCNSKKPYSEWREIAFFRLSKIFNKNAAQIIISLTKPKADGKELKNKDDAFRLYINNLSAAPAETILIKMADRLHNLRTLKDTTPEKQRRKITETKEIYLPLFQKVLIKYPEEGRYMLDQMNKAIEDMEAGQNI